MEEKIATIKKKVDKQVPDEEEKEDNLNDDDWAKRKILNCYFFFKLLKVEHNK